MNPTWTTIFAIAAFFSAAGVAFDKFLLNKQKNKLHTLMVAWWDRLDNTQIPDLHKLMASFTISGFQKVFGFQLFSFRSIALAVLFSFFLTSGAAIVGQIIDGSMKELSYYFENKLVPLMHFYTYVVNFLFDALTIMITLKVLSIIRSKGRLISTALILLDVILALILSIGCLTLSSAIGRFSLEHKLVWTSQIATEQETLEAVVKKYTEENNAAFRYEEVVTIFPIKYSNLERMKIATHSIIDFLISGSNSYSYNTTIRVELNQESLRKKITIPYTFKHFLLYHILFSLTTFIPIFLYLSIFVIIVIAKPVLAICKVITMYVLEVATESNPSINHKDFIPGTMFGILIGLVTALGKAIIELS